MITYKDVICKREPDFANILSVLKKQKPARPTLFEFFMNENVYGEVTGKPVQSVYSEEGIKVIIEAYSLLGYDYVTLHASGFTFETERHQEMSSISLNHGSVIADTESFKHYSWKSPTDVYDGRLERLSTYLPAGMKYIVYGPGGLLENVIALMGYDNLCIQLFEDPALVEAVFHEVGERLLEYYACIVDNVDVGAVISNDDWGFNTQTLLAPDTLRKYVFPYHKRIATLAHNAGKPIILHSCGRLHDVYDDIVCDIRFDGKHSYEDVIEPVEQAYERLHGKIAILGGLDVDFMVRAGQEAILDRSTRMLELSQKHGGYALGTGNSVPAYLPNNHYYAMIYAALCG